MGAGVRIRAGIALALSAASGLMYEVAATNILFYYFVQSSYSIATVISVFLLGLGIGSFAAYAFRDKVRNPHLLLAGIQGIIAAYALIILTQLERIIAHISALGIVTVSAMLLIVPTVLLGATFALAGQIIQERRERTIGLVYALDLAGAVLGTIAAGFWLLPHFGNTMTLMIAAALNIAAALSIMRSRKYAAIIGACLAIAVIAFAFWNPQPAEMPRAQAANAEIRFFNDSQRSISQPSQYGIVELRGNRLYIDSHDECTLDFEQGEIRIVALTLAQFETNQLRVANVGLGCGKTAAAIVQGVSTTVDIIEINPVVAEVSRELTNLLDHPRTRLIIAEGYQYFRNTDQKYDAIIIDIENPAVLHSSNIYTKEAFHEIKGDLNSNGVFALWSYPCPSDRYNAILASTLATEFTHIYHPTPEIFLASDRKLGLEEFPAADAEINTLDRKPLSRVYFDECGFWFSPQNSTAIMYR